MDWVAGHGYALLLLALYVLVLARHAWSGRRETRGVEDYYVGGRSMGGVAIGLSFFATYSSTNSFVGFSGQSYLWGAPWLLLAPAVVIFSLLAWLWIAPRLREVTADLGSLTIPDYLGFRFGSDAARMAAAVIVLFASFLYITAIFKGVGETLAAFLDLPYPVATWIVFVIVMTYTALGGFISVVRTDVVQGLMLVVAAAIMFTGTVWRSGGLATFFDVQRSPASAHLFSWDAAMPFPVLLGIIFAGSIKFIVEPRQLSRFYALRDQRAVRTGRWVSTLTFLVVYSLLVPIGIYARNIYPTGFGDSDLVVPALLTDPGIFHPAVSAFVLVALIAAAMSSLDSVLLVMASTFQRDVMELVLGEVSGRAALRSTRVYVAVFALVTTLIALEPPGTIVQLTAFSGSLYAACFLPALLFGLYGRRGNGRAVVASFAAGVGCLVAWEPLGIWAGIHAVFPSLVLSTVTFAAVARSTRPATARRAAGRAASPTRP